MFLVSTNVFLRRRLDDFLAVILSGALLLILGGIFVFTVSEGEIGPVRGFHVA